MKKFFFCISLALTGLMTSCIDKYEEVDADSKPEWLGSSIYAELKNPSAVRGLQGTFNTYLQLIDDLDQAEILSRTGSKTVFPANDEAFERFFSPGGNPWGVTSYNQLSYTQKVLLLKSSMIDNPLLLQLLPNVSNGTVEPNTGQGIKHSTNVQVIDTIQTLNGQNDMPANNAFWTPFYQQNIDIVSDATRPQMVHLTREYMIKNGITFNDENSDFAIITGSKYPEDGKTAYIFNDRVIVPDVTCQNGYIHQMEYVVVPPGNMAQVLRNKDNTKYVSRILDYFAVPVVSDKVTNDYNSWARDNNKPEKSAIYVWRYVSSRSWNIDKEGGAGEEELANKRVNGTLVTKYLDYDPGWNGYYPTVSSVSGRDVSIMGIGAMFVPSDDAVKNYFLPSNGDPDKGHGAYLVDIYGNYKGSNNTAEHLAENLDSIHSQNPDILTVFMKNLMQASFADCVPSKFDAVLNTASEHMGLSVDMIHTNADGKRDIVMANNGAIYVLDELIAPDEYQSVMSPAIVYPDLKVMGWAVQDTGSDTYHLGQDYQYYLLAMKANYAFFIPEDSAFASQGYYYLDPATLGHRKDNTVNGPIRPDVLRFWIDPTATPTLKVERYYYDLENGTIEGEARAEQLANVKSQLVDILNYHTLVLKEEGGVKQEIGQNHYYKTKHGGAVYVDGANTEGTHVMSGLQMDQTYYDELQDRQIAVKGFEAPAIKTVYPEKNGYAYRMDRVIQPPLESVYGVLKGTAIGGEKVFSEFLDICNGFKNTTLLSWAGISAEQKETGGTEQDAYQIFTSDYHLGTTSIEDACLDMNVKMFNTYNYTLFAPDNTAMAVAYQRGLPKWSEVQALFEKYNPEEGEEVTGTDEEGDKEKAFNMIKAIRDFTRYHFMTNSIFADNTVEGGIFKTLSSDDLGVAKEVSVSGGGGKLVISDAYTSRTGSVEVKAADKGAKVVNKMARDYWFDNKKTHAKSIVTSSFCTVHQISEPLSSSKNGRYDNDL